MVSGKVCRFRNCKPRGHSQRQLLPAMYVEGDSHGVVKQRLPFRLEVPCDVQRRHGTIYDVSLVQRPTRLARGIEERIYNDDARIDRADDVSATVNHFDIFYAKLPSFPLCNDQYSICMGGEASQK